MATYATAADLTNYASDSTFDPLKIEALLRRAEDDIDRILPVTGPVLALFLSGDPTGGSFTITINGQTTAAIPWNSTAATIDAAIEALSRVGVGGVTLYGGPLPNESVQIALASSVTENNTAINLTTASSLTGGTNPLVNLTWRRIDPSRIPFADRIALMKATCAQAEYRNEMGPKFFRRPQYASVGGPDFTTKGKLPYYAPMVKRELAKTSLQVTGARASAGVGSRPLGSDWVPPFGPSWPAPIERWWET